MGDSYHSELRIYLGYLWRFQSCWATVSLSIFLALPLDIYISSSKMYFLTSRVVGACWPLLAYLNCCLTAILKIRITILLPMKDLEDSNGVLRLHLLLQLNQEKMNKKRHQNKKRKKPKCIQLYTDE